MIIDRLDDIHQRLDKSLGGKENCDCVSESGHEHILTKILTS